MSENIIEKRVLNAIKLLQMSEKKTSIRAIAKILWKEKSLLTIQNAIDTLIESGHIKRNDKKEIEIIQDIFE